MQPYTQEATWAALIHQVAQGDQQALGTLYDATSTLVYGLALRILKNPASAEEVTLDVYTQVWRQAMTFTAQRGTPATWLFVLTRSRALDQLRRNPKGQAYAATDAIAATAHAAASPEELSVVAERSRLVRTALAALPVEQRTVLELAYFSGLSHGDMATQLGIPLGTVKTRLRLGLLRLREFLRPLMT